MERLGNHSTKSTNDLYKRYVLNYLPKRCTDRAKPIMEFQCSLEKSNMANGSTLHHFNVHHTENLKYETCREFHWFSRTSWNIVAGLSNEKDMIKSFNAARIFYELVRFGAAPRRFKGRPPKSSGYTLCL